MPTTQRRTPTSPPSFSPTTREREEERFATWALSELGLVDRITQPVTPIGNIYFMLEIGPPAQRTARCYTDAGHCAFKYQSDWAPATFSWLQERLSADRNEE